jgi:hypothetical protein
MKFTKMKAMTSLRILSWLQWDLNIWIHWGVIGENLILDIPGSEGLTTINLYTTGKNT